MFQNSTKHNTEVNSFSDLPIPELLTPARAMSDLKHLMTCAMLELLLPVQTGRLGEGSVMELRRQRNLAIPCRDRFGLIYDSKSHVL